MFANTIENINDGAADHDYDLASVGTNESQRVERAAPLDQPATLSIAHQTVGSGLAQVRRSKVRFDRVVEDADGNQGVCSAYLNIVQPVKVATSTQCKATTAELLAFLAVTGALDAILAGEI